MHKKIRNCFFSAQLAGCISQISGNAVLGGALGGGAGAAVGSAVGGQNGAMLGAATGVAIATSSKNEKAPVVAYRTDGRAGEGYSGRSDRGRHLGHYKHHHGHD